MLFCAPAMAQFYPAGRSMKQLGPCMLKNATITTSGHPGFSLLYSGIALCLLATERSLCLVTFGEG